MTGDALDRAAQAAFARWSDRLTWADLDETFGQAWRAQTAAALRVMADEIRALHHPDPATKSEWCVECDDGHWPCATVRILDAYTGGHS